MITPNEIENYLVTHTPMAAQSVVSLRPRFPRWIRHLESQGITTWPDPYSFRPYDSHAMNVIVQLIREGSAERDPAIEHNLRNMTGVRPWKP